MVSGIQPRPAPNFPSPRQLELQRIKADGLITPTEEGEMRGRFAHPGNDRAIELVQREYLASKNLGDFTIDEKEELRVIRAEAHAAKSSFEARSNLRDHEEAARAPIQADSEFANDRLKLEITEAKIACLKSTLMPGVLDIETLDRLIDDLPEKPMIVPKGHAALFSKPEIPKLAALLLTCCDGISIGEDVKKDDGSLTVIAGINCLKDQVRTKRFLESMRTSVDKLAESKDEVHVFDAGCGAVPIFSIYAAMRSDKVKVTAVELNPNSYKIAQQLINKLGLQGRINLVQADATKIKPDEPIDLLVSETMHSGLTQEMMVPIMRNLAPEVRQGGIILPQAVKVKVGIASLNRYSGVENMAMYYSQPHMHVIPDWQDEIEFKPGDDLQEINLEIDTTGMEPGLHLVTVSSDVQLPAGSLGDFDSLITTPQIILEPDSSPDDATPWVLDLKPDDIGKKVLVSYKPGSDSRGLAKLID
jgi:predicted RNA methylase